MTVQKVKEYLDNDSTMKLMRDTNRMAKNVSHLKEIGSIFIFHSRMHREYAAKPDRAD